MDTFVKDIRRLRKGDFWRGFVIGSSLWVVLTAALMWQATKAIEALGAV